MKTRHDDWINCLLGDVVTLKRGYDLPLSQRQDGPYPVITSSGHTGFHREAKVKGPGVVTGRYGTLGEVYFIENDFWPHNTVLYVQDFKGNHPRFVSYFLMALNFGTQNAAAAVPGVNRNFLHMIPVRVPPLPIQRRIAGILSAYDELIENSQRRIRILEAMARGLYREWFVHFRFPGHADSPRVASALGEIPAGWEVRRLELLMANHIGGGWGKDTPDESHTEPAWVIRGTDIPDARSSQVTGVPHRYHTPSNLRSRRLSTGDIVFEVSGGSKGQPVGRTLLITPELRSAFDGDVICASFCKRIRPDSDGYGSELLYLSFLEGYESGEIEQFQVQSTGISNFKWTEYISKVERIVPSEPLRARFHLQVAPIFTQIATLGLQIQTLRRTRDLLLPRLLAGQVEIS